MRNWKGNISTTWETAKVDATCWPFLRMKNALDDVLSTLSNGLITDRHTILEKLILLRP